MKFAVRACLSLAIAFVFADAAIVTVPARIPAQNFKAAIVLCKATPIFDLYVYDPHGNEVARHRRSPRCLLQSECLRARTMQVNNLGNM